MAIARGGEFEFDFVGDAHRVRVRLAQNVYQNRRMTVGGDNRVIPSNSLFDCRRVGNQNIRAADVGGDDGI